MSAVKPDLQLELPGCSNGAYTDHPVAWRHARPACASLALAIAMLAAPAQAQETTGDRTGTGVAVSAKAPERLRA